MGVLHLDVVESTLKVCYRMVEILTDLGICGHSEFMQIKTLKLRHMEPCVNQRISGNSILRVLACNSGTQMRVRDSSATQILF